MSWFNQAFERNKQIALHPELDLRKINKKMPSWGQDLKHLEGVQPLRIYYDVQPLRSWNSAIHMELSFDVEQVVDSTRMEKMWRNEPMIRADLPSKKRRTMCHSSSPKIKNNKNHAKHDMIQFQPRTLACGKKTSSWSYKFPSTKTSNFSRKISAQVAYILLQRKCESRTHKKQSSGNYW